MRLSILGIFFTIFLFNGCVIKQRGVVQNSNPQGMAGEGTPYDVPNMKTYEQIKNPTYAIPKKNQQILDANKSKGTPFLVDENSNFPTFNKKSSNSDMSRLDTHAVMVENADIIPTNSKLDSYSTLLDTKDQPEVSSKELESNNLDQQSIDDVTLVEMSGSYNDYVYPVAMRNPKEKKVRAKEVVVKKEGKK